MLKFFNTMKTFATSPRQALFVQSVHVWLRVPWEGIILKSHEHLLLLYLAPIKETGSDSRHIP